MMLYNHFSIFLPKTKTNNAIKKAPMTASETAKNWKVLGFYFFNLPIKD